MKARIAVISFCLLTSLGAQDYSLTVFGTEQTNHHTISDRFSRELDRLKSLYDRDWAAYRNERDIFAAKLRTLGNFAHCNVMLMKNYAGTYSFILDFVDLGDAATRLNFRTLDPRSFDDPDSLIAKWMAYESLSFKLFRKGEITDMNCPVVHCI